MAINRHLLHVKSNQTVTTTVDNESVTRAKLPSPTNIEHGEIAINYHDGYETISIKNDNNEIVEFPNLNVVNTLINDGDKIKSLTTYEASTPLAVGDTHDQALSKLSKIIDDNETVVARALTELEDTKADKDDLYTKDEVDNLIEETNDSLTQIIEDNELTIATALNDLDSRISNMKGSIEELNEPSESTPLAVGDTYDDAFAKLTKIIRDDEEITARALTDLNETKQDEITDLDTIRSGAARGATALQSETQLSKGTSTGDGNVVTDIAVNNHQITLTMGLTALTEGDLLSYADGAEYDSTEKKIYLKHGATRLSNPIDATDFIKDGMVNSVRIDTIDDGSSVDGSDGSDWYEERYLIITFNTDAGLEDIEIPLSDIFDSRLYYTKEEIDEHELVTAAALTELHDTKQDLLSFDSTPTANSTNPVTSGGIKTSLDSKQDALTFDTTPTANSTNPVTSGGVYAALSNVNTDHLTEVTYSELKTLRDNDELVPGMFYRITDYQCTTTQENTHSAGHQFDIVLLALSENKLAEEGWAMMHDNIYDVTFNGGVVKKCYFSRINTNNTYNTYSLVDIETMLGISDMVDGEFTIDEENKTITTIDYVYTDLITENVPYNYFQNSNLSAWKVWYCLDNDKSRFAWADDGEALSITLDEGGNYDVYVRYPQGDIEGKFAWSKDEESNLYSDNPFPKIGDTIYTYETQFVDDYFVTAVGGLGRGVIYRLIDEFNNDIKYDFKNIQFKRKITNGQYDENGTPTWCYTLNVWYNDMCQDASIVGNILPNDEGFVNGVYDNNFGYATAYDFYIEGVNTFAFALGDNVVLSIDEGGEYYGIYSNTIGNNFVNNTIGNRFYQNTIGNYFGYNTIGNNFVNNTIGNSFSTNTIGNSFSDNTIDNGSYSNTIGNGFASNTIDNYFYQNTIGNYFQDNTIGNYFYQNTIGTRAGSTATTIDYVRYIRVEDGVRYVNITTTATTSASAYLQNITISQGIAGVSNSNRKTISHPTVGDTFKTTYQSANSQVVSV